MHVGDVQAVAPRCGAVDCHIDITPAGQPLGQRRRHARHAFGHLLDAQRNTIDCCQVAAADLDADRALDAGGQHVDAVADRRHPDVGQSRHLHRAVQLLDQLVRRHACSPLLAGFKLDGRLEHLQRRRIGGGFGAAGLAEHAFDLGDGLDHAVGQLQQLGRLLRRQPRQRRRHVQQVAFVEPGQEFAAQAHQRPDGGGQRQQRDDQRGLRPLQHPVQRRAVDGDQQARDRVTPLVGDAPAYPVAHQHRDQRHRQPRRRGHGVGLGESQRAEQPPFLRLQREHRDERQRDDQQREEQRRPDLDRRVGDHLPALVAVESAPGMRVLPGFDLLVRVLDHHHCGVDHRADGDGDATQRHDVGVDALPAHHQEREHHAQRQRDDGHRRRAQVPQEQHAHQRDDDELLEQLVRQVVDRAFDQGAAVVGGDDLHALRQARLAARPGASSPPGSSPARSCPSAARRRRRPPRPRRRARRCRGASRGPPGSSPRQPGARECRPARPAGCRGSRPASSGSRWRAPCIRLRPVRAPSRRSPGCRPSARCAPARG